MSTHQYEVCRAITKVYFRRITTMSLKHMPYNSPKWRLTLWARKRKLFSDGRNTNVTHSSSAVYLFPFDITQRNELNTRKSILQTTYLPSAKQGNENVSMELCGKHLRYYIQVADKSTLQEKEKERMELVRSCKISAERSDQKGTTTDTDHTITHTVGLPGEWWGCWKCRTA